MFESLRINMTTILRKIACDYERHSHSEADRIANIRQFYTSQLQELEAQISAERREQAELKHALSRYGIRD